MTGSLLRFVEQNPTDPRAKRIMRAMDKPLSLNSNIGALIGRVMREQIEKETALGL